MIRLLLAATLFASLASPASAQVKGRKVAFLVGVGSFKHDLPDLNGSPQKDVKALAEVLRSGGFDVVLLTDAEATRELVAERFTAVLGGDGNKDKALGKDDLLLACFCTHGFTLPPEAGKPDAPFLAAHDSRSNNPATMVALNGLIEDGRKSGATVLYLIDACREIPDANRGARGVEGTQVRLPASTAILFSCGRGQFSHQSARAGGHGLFTFAVLKVLKGEAGIKDEVSWSGLVYEVERAFQSPEFRALIPPGRPQRPYMAAGELDATPLMQLKPAVSFAADLRAYEGSISRSVTRLQEVMGPLAAERLAAWRERAAAGDPVAQTLYGVCLGTGVGVPLDATEAVRWYRKAADAGQRTAMYNLGWVYANGHGVEKDEAEAVRWYTKSADAGDPRAMTNLGWMYESGNGTAKDEAAAAKWYRKAADTGHPLGMSNLATMYLEGAGVPKDEAEAVRLYRKAADADEPLGVYNLGLMYLNGRGGLTADRAEAVRLIRKAAAMGSPAAIDYLKNIDKD